MMLKMDTITYQKSACRCVVDRTIVVPVHQHSSSRQPLHFAASQLADGMILRGVHLSAGEKAECMLRMRPSFMAAIWARMLLACLSSDSSLASCAACRCARHSNNSHCIASASTT